MSNTLFEANNITLTREDALDAMLDRHRSNTKRKIIILIASCMLTLGILLLLGSPLTFSKFTIAGSLGVLVLVLLHFFPLAIIRVAIAKINVTQSYNLKSTDGGFETTGENGNAAFTWSDFKACHISKNALLLQNLQGTNFIIPKSAFDSNALDNFERAIKDNIK